MKIFLVLVIACGGSSNDTPMAKLRDRMCACADAACAAQLAPEVASAARAAGSPTPPAVAQAMLELDACRDKLVAGRAPSTGGDAGVATPDAGAGSVAIPAACDAYKAAHERMAACSKLGAVRDGLARAYDAAADAWANPSALSPAAQAGMADACKLGARTITDALAAAGCK